MTTQALFSLCFFFSCPNLSILNLPISSPCRSPSLPISLSLLLSLPPPPFIFPLSSDHFYTLPFSFHLSLYPFPPLPSTQPPIRLAMKHTIPIRQAVFQPAAPGTKPHEGRTCAGEKFCPLQHLISALNSTTGLHSNLAQSDLG